ncbi:MAG: universal stress protein [Pseudorhodoplanes sp.]|nr:universal stress protein [Pseudorhodoplanes sp.]
MIHETDVRPDAACGERQVFSSDDFSPDKNMISARTILLASHGTAGARAAEKVALDICADGGRIHQLVVVPDFWKGMLGDDWLNNAAVHIRFGRYVENQLQREIAEHAAALEAEATRRRLAYSCEIRLGKPAESLVAVAAAGGHDLIVVGSPRPKGARGLRSRLATELLVRTLKVPLLVVPHPDR